MAVEGGARQPHRPPRRREASPSLPLGPPPPQSHAGPSPCGLRCVCVWGGGGGVLLMDVSALGIRQTAAEFARNLLEIRAIRHVFVGIFGGLLDADVLFAVCAVLPLPCRRAGLPVLDAHAMTLPRSDATQVPLKAVARVCGPASSRGSCAHPRVQSYLLVHAPSRC